MIHNQPCGHALYSVSFDNGLTFESLSNVFFELNDKEDEICMKYELRTSTFSKTINFDHALNDTPLILLQKIREDIGFYYKLYILEAEVNIHYNDPEISIAGYILEMECLHCSHLNKQIKEYTQKGVVTIPDTELVL
jgi:hypothetical protein